MLEVDLETHVSPGMDISSDERYLTHKHDAFVVTSTSVPAQRINLAIDVHDRWKKVLSRYESVPVLRHEDFHVGVPSSSSPE